MSTETAIPAVRTTVRLESPYPQGEGLRWLKGNLHVHTTRSDGEDSPQEAIQRYAELGYDFLMLSDHDQPADLTGLDPCGLVLLPGNEVSSGGPHILDVGARFAAPAQDDRQAVIDDINRNGGFAVLCHPNWQADYGHHPYSRMVELRDFAGVEIFNGGCLDAPGSPYAFDHWLRLLSAGRAVWGFANDDSHSHAKRRGTGYNVVLARERSDGAILEALRRGAFYATNGGLRIDRIDCPGPVLQVRAPDAEAIAVFGQDGARLAYGRGAELFFDASGTVSSFLVPVCYGYGDAVAWAQPVRVRGGGAERLQWLMQNPPRLRASFAARRPRLTGAGHDPLWSGAEPTTRFIAAGAGEPAGVLTEVRCIAAPDALCFLIRCEEPRMDALRCERRNGDKGIFTDDSMEIFLSPRGETGPYLQVIVNARGAACAVLPRGPTGAIAPAVSARAGSWDKGFVLEVAVPLEGFAGKPQAGESWGLHFCRNRKPIHETLFWAWVGDANHTPSRFGRLEFASSEVFSSS